MVWFKVGQLPTEVHTCAHCGQKKWQSGAGSITQWISACQCDLQLDEERTADVCANCGERIGNGSAGSLTQWVFRNKVCQCAEPDPVVALDRSAIGSARGTSSITQRKFGAPEREASDDAGLTIDSSRFPVERYRPLKALGAGGAGTVYLCWDEHLRKHVAVKVLLDLNQESLVSFQQEAVATAKVKHLNVIGILDFGISDSGTPYMVLEYFIGMSLERYLAQNAPLDLSLSVRFFLQLADALVYGHEANVFHRDIKSSNVLVVEDDSGDLAVKLIDFGIAAILGNQANTQVQGRTLVGTPKYMSPDQALGLRFDARSEIYSLGCLMFEVLTGRVPFVGEDPLTLISMHSSEPVPSMKEVSSFDVPPELESVVRKCLEKQPADRFQSMHELKQEIEAAEKSMLARVEDLSVEPEESPVAPKVEAGTKTGAVIAAVVVVVLLIALVGLFLRNSSNFRLSSGTPEITAKKKKAIARRKAPSVLMDIPEDLMSSNSDFEFTALPNGGLKVVAPSNTIVDGKKLASLRDRPNLQCLNLAGAEFVGGLEHVADLPIVSLDLSDTNIDDKGFTPVAHMKRLTLINLEDCYELTDKSLSCLRHLPLKQISMRGTRFGDAGLAYLKDTPVLETLNLIHTQISAAGLRRLKGHPKLHALVVDFKNRPVEYFQAIADIGTQDLTIESVDVPAKMTDEIFNILMNVRRVVFVNLEVSKEQLSRLSNARKLTVLCFQHSFLSGTKLKALANSSVKEMGLCSEPNLNQVGFLELRRIKTLKHIYIRDCPQVSIEARRLLMKERPDIRIHESLPGSDGR